MTQDEDKSDLYDKGTADEIDRASAMEMETTKNAVLEVQSRCKPVQPRLDDGSFEFTDCEDCGNEIGAERLAVAIKNHLCTPCAAAQEHRNRFINYR